MSYIVLDLEWNQPWAGANIMRRSVPLTGEVVQIGAVKLSSEDRSVADTLKLTVKPKYYKRMHSRVARLTNIRNADLREGMSFPEAFARLDEWCGEGSVILTWGPDDIPMLESNMRLHGIEKPLPPSYDLQLIYDRTIAHEGRQVSLTEAMERLGEPALEAHDALNDALNTAVICKRIDVEAGIGEYDELIKSSVLRAGEAARTRICKGYARRRNIFEDEEVLYFECPVCGARGKVDGFVYPYSDRCAALGSCGEHEFFVRVKIVHAVTGEYRITRILYLMDDNFRERYERQKEKEAASKAKKPPAF